MERKSLAMSVAASAALPSTDDTLPIRRAARGVTLLGRLRRGLGRRIPRRGARPLALVLMYHRVAPPALDPWGLRVTEAHFADHAARLARHWNVLPLAELANALAAGRSVPARSVAISFDDGYRDNLECAAPILAAAGLPATFFVSTSQVATGTPFWWDTVERLCTDEAVLAAGLGTAIEATTASPAGTSSGSPPLAIDAGTLRAFGLSAGVARLPRAVRRAYVELWRTCHALEPAPRNALLDALEARRAAIVAARRPVPAGPPDDAHAILSAADLEVLFAEPSFDCGSHGVTHTPLDVLDVSAQRRELVESRDWLRERSGRVVELCSYPNGVRPSPELLDASDFPYRAAFTTDAAAVRASDTLRALPRVKVDDLDDAAFAGLLARHGSG